MTSPAGAPAESALTHLQGSMSGRRYRADQLVGLDPADGRPLLARYDLERAASTLTPVAVATRTTGLWRWAEVLPVRDPHHRLSLGEGATPLLSAERLGRDLGVRGLRVKAEGLNPTGSFKARGMAAAVSRAVELGATSFVVPSAGNAGGALAAYGAAAGAEVTVVMPTDAPPANQAEVMVMGARLLLVDGLISDCGKVAAAIARRTGAFDVSTLREPYRVEGKKTMGYELAEAGGWRLPDVVVYPTGGGTGLIGLWKAFAEMEAMGLAAADRPRMVCVQAEGCAPLVRAFHAGKAHAEPWREAVTRAAGLRVPAAIGDFLVLEVLRASGGTAVSVDEDAISSMQLHAGRLGAGYISPETAAAFAALDDLRRSGAVDADSRVVVLDTGAGHKYPPPPGLPEPVVVDPDTWDAGEG